MTRRIEPFFFKGRNSSTSHARQRSILGKKEKLTASMKPRLVTWKRRRPDGSLVTAYKIERAGDGVLPIRISRVTGTPIEPIEFEEFILYQESGILEWSFPSVANPARLLPAEWKIPGLLSTVDLDLYKSLYQGYLNDDETVYETTQDSLAIDYGSEFIMKKLVSGFFQPSEFTGLLRMYMQSQLGGNNIQGGTYQLSISLVGTQVVLLVDSQQVGEWAHLSSGIVRGVSSDPFDYRFVVISTEVVGDDVVVSVKECPIILAAHPQARIDYEAATGTPKEKILTYLFAHSTIRTDLFREVGTRTVTNQPGGSLSGWKFNNAGNKAAIVLMGRKVAVSGNDYYRSKQVEISFGVSGGNVTIASFVQNPSKNWTAVPIVQMWTPNPDKTTSSRAYTIRTLTNPYNFQSWDWEDVPFYCYFDKDDTLIECKFSHENTGALGTYVFKYGGNLVPTQPTVTNFQHLVGGYSVQNQGRWFSELRVISGMINTIKIGAKTYTQVNQYGDYTRYDVQGTGSGSSDFTVRSFVQNTWHAFSSPGYWTPDYQAYLDGGPYFDTEVEYLHGTQSMDVTTGRVNDGIWCDLYVPLGDAEAILVGEMEIIDPEATVTVDVKTFTDAIVNQLVRVKVNAGDPWTSGAASMYVWDEARPNWVPSTTVPADPEAIEEVPSMFIHSRQHEGVETDYWQSTSTYFGRGYDAEDPAAISYWESWRLAAAKGSNVDGPDGGASPVLDMSDYPGIFSGHV